jgi:hypothetical protein
MADVTNVLNQISTAPSGNEAFNAWLGTEDAVAFLKDNAQQDKLEVYAVVQCTFMHAILVTHSGGSRRDPCKGLKGLSHWCHP